MANTYIDSPLIDSASYIHPIDTASMTDAIAPNQVYTGEFIHADPKSNQNNFVYVGTQNATQRRSDVTSLIGTTASPISNVGLCTNATGKNRAVVRYQQPVSRVVQNNMANLGIYRDPAKQDILHSSTMFPDTTTPGLVFFGTVTGPFIATLYDMRPNIPVPVWTIPGGVSFNRATQDTTHRYATESVASNVRKIDKATGTFITSPNLGTSLLGVYLFFGDLFVVASGTGGVWRLRTSDLSIISQIAFNSAAGGLAIHPTKPDTLIATLTAGPGMRELNTLTNLATTIGVGHNAGYGFVYTNSQGRIFATNSLTGSTATINELDPGHYGIKYSRPLDNTGTLNYNIATFFKDGDSLYMAHAGTTNLFVAIWDMVTCNPITSECRFSAYNLSGVDASWLVKYGNSLIVRINQGKTARIDIAPVAYSIDDITRQIIPTTQQFDLPAPTDTLYFEADIPSPTFISCQLAKIGVMQ